MTQPVPKRIPLCWNNKANWVEWHRLNVLARDNPKRPLDHFCTDCMPEFKARMVAEGKCEHPTVRFIPIIERQYDPHLMRRQDVVTDAVKGVRE